MTDTRNFIEDTLLAVRDPVGQEKARARHRQSFEDDGSLWRRGLARNWTKDAIPGSWHCGGYACPNALVAMPCIAGAQEKPIIKKTFMKQTSSVSGKETYTEYCAACHGADAKGTGPEAAALKTPPPDLTTLAKRSQDGKFPRDRVATLLRSGTEVAAYGSSDMPIWGPLFKSLDPTHDIAVPQRIRNLNDYLVSLQAK
ncbi:MAG: hypothetical protein DMG39_13300 [Acidobacteria bacterium]|nr:MAG: hypothetical protein DMG39_13300 [Acidobacteriota bacterium]